MCKEGILYNEGGETQEQGDGALSSLVWLNPSLLFEGMLDLPPQTTISDGFETLSLYKLKYFSSKT